MMRSASWIDDSDIYNAEEQHTLIS
jgi:hypothetical protein